MAEIDISFKIAAHNSGQQMCRLGGMNPDVWEPIGDTLQTTERLADRASVLRKATNNSLFTSRRTPLGIRMHGGTSWPRQDFFRTRTLAHADAGLCVDTGALSTAAWHVSPCRRRPNNTTNLVPRNLSVERTSSIVVAGSAWIDGVAAVVPTWTRGTGGSHLSARTSRRG